MNNYNLAYVDLQVSYERALALKENRLEEYERQMEDDWDFEVHQRMM